MNGFSAEVLSEIRIPENDCCKLAFLSAAIHAAGTLELSEHGRVVTVHRVKSELIAPIVEQLFGITPTVTAHATVFGGDVHNVLRELGILELTDDGLFSIVDGIEPHIVAGDCCKAAYLKGVFAAAGSMTVGRGGNRLQFAVSNPQFAEDLSSMLSSLGVASFVTAHRDKYITYLKRAESISDCLILLGATKTMLAFEAHTVEMECKKTINRANNIEISNILRAAGVGTDQREAIRKIERTVGLDALDPKLREVAELRLKRDTASYGEMAAVLGVSKSNVQYRLEKIMAYARTL